MSHRQPQSDVASSAPVVTTLLDPGPAPLVAAHDEQPMVKPGQCSAHTTAGPRCRRQAIRGGSVCYVHGGAARQVKRQAARRLAEREATTVLADVGVVVIDNPIERLAEVVARVGALELHLANLLAEVNLGTASAEQLGTFHAWERALDRCGKLLADWVRLGFDERMVNLHERQVDLVEAYMLAVVAELDLTAEQAAAVPAAAVRHLTMLTGGQAAA